MLYSCFQKKSVVNVVNGSELGYVSDLLFDAVTGKIHKIIVDDNTGLLKFFKKEESIALKWNQIVKIGEDVIIVNYSCDNVIKGE